jgi:hypothetical protein
MQAGRRYPGVPPAAASWTWAFGPRLHQPPLLVYNAWMLRCNRLTGMMLLRIFSFLRCLSCLFPVILPSHLFPFVRSLVCMCFISYIARSPRVLLVIFQLHAYAALSI